MTLFKSFIILLLMSSCVEVGFKHPQPSKGKTLTKIPQKMVEFYTGNRQDSISENSNYLKFEDYINDKTFENSLSETTILKKWKGKYFLNQKEDDLWRIIMIVPVSNNNYETYQLDGSNKQTVKLLKDITAVKEIFSEDGKLKLLILDPSRKEFNKIIKSGAFELIDIF